ncbi:5-oxoprolinase subunit PxpB [Staphylococcus sp. KG4-3]|uniref:5-oxoprolinase subunit PxpB n=1 Tax=Staphylococcus xylosus TaxID=1288 RepID=A0A418ILE0_STAXY|nr:MULTISPECIES: 5-oxoprolinase subunit PxpB [Staphylococcus]MDW8542325.1 5-oxoprolinase subunit PxpB [Staphylococcus sp. KG4-1]MDW8561693.1 5-oxoprolinase subunit PxpB [Staphylococcus sp. KG4-3]RIN08742.1 5-oxoprolinase subunit PxpB [Staphylococcus xylosus]
MDYKLINEQTIMIYFEAQINHEIFNKVQQIRQYIINQKHPAIIDIVPSYRAIMLSIDIAQCDVNQLVEELKLDQSDNKLEAHTRGEAKQINIPVFYGGEYGQDLNEVASYNNLSEEEVVQLHTENTYLIYMLGFMPGFPFLGGLNPQLHTPRRQEPRTSIPAGSVGIANNQTGLYPMESPGGWQIIGRTPIRVFDINRSPMCLYNSGDTIKFYSIDEETFKHIQQSQLQDDFEISKWVNI